MFLFLVLGIKPRASSCKAYGLLLPLSYSPSPYLSFFKKKIEYGIDSISLYFFDSYSLTHTLSLSPEYIHVNLQNSMLDVEHT
jgi:hypothetical protein